MATPEEYDPGSARYRTEEPKKDPTGSIIVWGIVLALVALAIAAFVSVTG